MFNNNTFESTIQRAEVKREVEQLNDSTIAELQRRAKKDARAYYRRQRKLLAAFYGQYSKGGQNGN